MPTSISKWLRPTTLGLISVGLLSACGSSTTPVAVSQPSGLGQAYQLSFDGVGTANASVSMQRVGGGLNSQALDNASETLPVTVVGYESFVTGGTRHIKVVLNFTNNTTAKIQHLTFVPLDTAPDGNIVPPTPATAGTTYFGNVKTVNGTPVPDATVMNMTPVTGQDFNVQTGTVGTDNRATPYTSLVGTANLNAGLPAGLQVGPGGFSNNGWRSTQGLPKNRNINVSFGVNVPAVSPTTDPYSFSLAVVAADDN